MELPILNEALGQAQALTDSVTTPEDVVAATKLLDNAATRIASMLETLAGKHSFNSYSESGL